VLNSKYSLDYATKIATGIAQKTVPLTGLRKMPIPLPPLAEQNRIVAKVDELMALCDQLKTRLHENQSTKLQLADTIVQQAVA
jgi:type I restriction enzyme S subunit